MRVFYYFGKQSILCSSSHLLHYNVGNIGIYFLCKRLKEYHMHAHKGVKARHLQAGKMVQANA